MLKLKSCLIDNMSDKTTSSTSPFRLPSSVRGMKVLDRDAFTINLSTVGLKVPIKSVGVVRQRYKHCLLKVPKLQPITELYDTDADRQTHRLFLFSPNCCKLTDAFGEGDRTFLSENGIDLVDFRQHTIKLTYDNFSYDDILDAILPENSGIGGFSVIGHIAHLNLRDNLLEYKNVIGRLRLISVFFSYHGVTSFEELADHRVCLTPYVCLSGKLLRKL